MKSTTVQYKAYGKELATFRPLTFTKVKAWSVPVPTPCSFCTGTGFLNSYNYVGPCGNCNGTGTDMVDTTPSHVWFVDTSGHARQAKINGKLRTWKRNAERIELPLKYGMYEYFIMDKADIDAGRLLERIG